MKYLFLGYDNLALVSIDVKVYKYWENNCHCSRNFKFLFWIHLINMTNISWMQIYQHKWCFGTFWVILYHYHSCLVYFDPDWGPILFIFVQYCIIAMESCGVSGAVRDMGNYISQTGSLSHHIHRLKWLSHTTVSSLEEIRHWGLSS